MNHWFFYLENFLIICNKMTAVRHYMNEGNDRSFEAGENERKDSRWLGVGG